MLICPGVVTLPGFFDQDEIDEINSFVLRHQMVYGTTAADGKTSEERAAARLGGSEYRMSRIGFIDRRVTYTCEPFVKFDAAIEYVNKTYFDQPIGKPEVWEGYQYADYDEDYQGFYKPHKDSGGSDNMRSRLISASLQLTDPSTYEGGELIIYPRGVGRLSHTAPKEIGTLTIFLSNIVHEVRPVTKGLRNSLVTWVH